MWRVTVGHGIWSKWVGCEATDVEGMTREDDAECDRLSAQILCVDSHLQMSTNVDVRAFKWLAKSTPADQ